MRNITVTLNSDGNVAHVDFVAWIMNEIEGKEFTRADVAHTYAILIQKNHRDWAPINGAILKRWSKSGLLWIKREAWKRVNSEAN